MNIREAARWAERKDALFINGNFAEPMCAATDDNAVECLGSYDKCQAFIHSRCSMNFAPGQTLVSSGSYSRVGDTNKYLRLYVLQTVCEEMEESDGEARCIPDAAELREWA